MKGGGALFGSAVAFLVVLAAFGLLFRHRLRGHAMRMQALMDHRIAERERAFA
jgi:hypothetical protein